MATIPRTRTVELDQVMLAAFAQVARDAATALPPRPTSIAPVLSQLFRNYDVMLHALKRRSHTDRDRILVMSAHIAGALALTELDDDKVAKRAVSIAYSLVNIVDDGDQ